MYYVFRSLAVASESATVAIDSSGDRSAIEAEIQRFIASYNSGDVAGVMRCYTDDLVKARNGAPSEGRRQTEARIADVLSKFSGQLSVINDEIVVSGDMAFARGSLSIVLTSRADGELRNVDLRFMEIWRKVDGRWLVSRTMDNVA
jgi:ketosteroid isomerase-like protein